MDPISNVDRLVLLLRQRIMERSKAAASGKAQGRKTADERGPAEPGGIQALAAIEGLDDRQLKRALIQNLLADQFGPRLVNDAKFQQVVDRVRDTLEADAAGSSLLTRLAAELRASAR